MVVLVVLPVLQVKLVAALVVSVKELPLQIAGLRLFVPEPYIITLQPWVMSTLPLPVISGLVTKPN